MALDGPEQVRRLRWPGGTGPRCEAGAIRGGQSAEAKGSGGLGGWTSPDWALRGTGSAVSAPPAAGQSRAGRESPGGSGANEGKTGAEPACPRVVRGRAPFLLVAPPVVVTPGFV